jgi:hypothetical protein
MEMYFGRIAGKTVSRVGSIDMTFDSPVINSNGDVFLAITFKGRLDVNPSPTDSLIYDEQNYYSAYIKLNSSGNLVSSRLLKSNSHFAYHEHMCLLNDKLYMYGSFRGQVDFDFSSGTMIKSTSGLNADAFILCMDTSLNFEWVKTHHTKNQLPSRMSIEIGNSGHIYTWFYSVGLNLLTLVLIQTIPSI